MNITVKPRTVLASLTAALMLALFAGAFGAASADAVTNGEPDGDGHPYAGVLVDDYVTPGYYQCFCSGTLVAPRLMLSAAHCFHGTPIDEVWANFDPVYRPGSSALIHGTAVIDMSWDSTDARIHGIGRWLRPDTSGQQTRTQPHRAQLRPGRAQCRDLWVPESDAVLRHPVLKPGDRLRRRVFWRLGQWRPTGPNRRGRVDRSDGRQCLSRDWP